jgi:ribosomal protein S7
MKIRQKKKFKLLDPKYNSYFIIKFVNNFTKHGEKNRIFNIIYKVFKKIKRIFNFNTMLFLRKFLKENKPLIIAKNITIAGKLFHIPKFILEYQKEIKVIM